MMGTGPSSLARLKSRPSSPPRNIQRPRPRLPGRTRLPGMTQVSDFDLDLSWLDDAAPLIAYYTERTPGSVVERKVSGLAWHYRDCDLNHGAWQARQLQVALGELAKHVPLSVFSGDKFIEVRPMRLSVPNVLELALRRLRDLDADLLQSAAEAAAAPGSPLLERSAATSDDEAPDVLDEDVERDAPRSVDYVLFVASGNGLVDEEIFESMAPPPFDLDEFCARVARLNAGFVAASKVFLGDCVFFDGVEAVLNYHASSLE